MSDTTANLGAIISLSVPFEVNPAIPAVTVTEFTVINVEENYGWGFDPANPMPNFGMARPNSVVASVQLGPDSRNTQQIIAWENSAYLSVRGKWTDVTLFDQLTAILEGKSNSNAVLSNFASRSTSTL
jgi:hypothetical protein